MNQNWLADIEAETLKSTQHAEQLEDQLKTALQQAGIWKQIRDYTQQDWPRHLQRLLSSKPAQALFSEQNVLVTAIANAAQAQIYAERHSYPHLLEAAFRAQGLKLDPHSHHPAYSLVDGYLRIDLIDASLAQISTAQRKYARIPADPQPLAAKTLEIHGLLFERKGDLTAFALSLQAACQGLARAQPWPLETVLRAWLKQVNKRQADHFILDLVALLETPSAWPVGFGPEVVQTRESDQGLYLPLKTRPGYFGWLRLK